MAEAIGAGSPEDVGQSTRGPRRLDPADHGRGQGRERQLHVPRLRRPPPAGEGPHRRLRPLRLLPADLPDLRPLRGGDGLPARAHLPHEQGPRRGADERRDGPPLGPLPRVHGLRHGLSLRRAVRQAHRGHARAGRAPLRAPGRRQGFQGDDLPVLPLPEPPSGHRRPDAPLPALRRRRQAAQGRHHATHPGQDARDGGAHAGSAERREDPGGHGPRRREAPQGRCPDGLRAAGVLLPGQRRHRPRPRRRGLRGRRAQAGLLRRPLHPRRPRGGVPGLRPQDHRHLRGSGAGQRRSSTPPAAARR